MMEERPLSFMKHLMFSWGLPKSTNGTWCTSKVDYGWGNIDMTLEAAVDVSYDNRYVPTEWLVIERYTNIRNFS